MHQPVKRIYRTCDQRRDAGKIFDRAIRCELDKYRFEQISRPDLVVYRIQISLRLIQQQYAGAVDSDLPSRVAAGAGDQDMTIVQASAVVVIVG